MKVHKRWLVVPLLLALLAPILVTPRSQAQPAAGRIKPGRIWVRLKHGDAATLRGRARALAAGEVKDVAEELDAAILEVGVGQEAAVARRLAARADVAFAAPIHEVRALETPNDPGLPSQWALATIGARSAWDFTTGNNWVTIAIVDTGVDLSHPDLAQKIWRNASEIAGNGKDDDGNGYVDDVQGWNFIAGSGDVNDDNGHGTHVTGIAAAATDNRLGIAGLSWGARAMPVKVLDKYGSGWEDGIALGVRYAVRNGARIINLSLGGSAPLPILQDALQYAQENGVLVVAAAGNSGGSVLYPAAYPEAMAVAATDATDQRAAFSSHGPQISVAAPGVDILSTYRGGGYCSMSGTSMAAPFVAGLAALVWSEHPEYTAAQVRARIEQTARDVNAASYPGRDEYLGWGRIDAAAALRDYSHRVLLPFVAR